MLWGSWCVEVQSLSSTLYRRKNKEDTRPSIFGAFIELVPELRISGHMGFSTVLFSTEESFLFLGCAPAQS